MCSLFCLHTCCTCNSADRGDVCRQTEQYKTALHLKRVFHEHISSMSAAESQRTQCHKELSGNLIMMNPIVDILKFGIHIRTQQQMTFCSNLAAAL